MDILTECLALGIFLGLFAAVTSLSKHLEKKRKHARKVRLTIGELYCIAMYKFGCIFTAHAMAMDRYFKEYRTFRTDDHWRPTHRQQRKKAA